jgi:ketosteroid isomerase-like protein
MTKGLLSSRGFAVIAWAVMGIVSAVQASAQTQNNDELLRVRASVWRAWFANDVKALEKLVPPETIVIGSGDLEWKNQAEVIQDAADFHSKGGKLLRLEFPRTEVQRFGNVAITYSQYLYETEEGGKRSVTSGRVTEIFVFRDGQWTNPGWHTDEVK